MNDDGQICIEITVRTVALPTQVILLAPPCFAGHGKAWALRQIWISSMSPLFPPEKNRYDPEDLSSYCCTKYDWRFLDRLALPFAFFAAKFVLRTWNAVGEVGAVHRGVAGCCVDGVLLPVLSSPWIGTIGRTQTQTIVDADQDQ